MNFLRRPVTLKPSDAMRFQAMADNAPVGSVGASGGLLAPKPVKKSNALTGLLAAGSAIPGVGDAVGLLGDAAMYASDPSSRTWPNALMTGLGALPFVPSAQQLAELAGPLSAMVVYHGSPHKFDAFDMSKIGTGEGAQAYGHGLYFAEAPNVAKEYQKKLSSAAPAKNTAARLGDVDSAIAETTARIEHYRKLIADGGGGAMDRAQGMLSITEKKLQDLQAMKAGLPENTGALYTVDLPDEAIAKMLDWDKPLSEQAPEVRNALLHTKNKQLRAMVDYANVPYSEAAGGETKTMGDAFRLLNLNLQGKSSADSRKASELLKKHGIPGIRYLDGGSRSGGKGTSNFVVFDDKLPKILKRE